MSPPPASSIEARGFSLVELMVGLTLGMLILLTLAQAYVAFNFQRRLISGSMNAQTAAMSALHAIERDVQHAALGFGDRRVLGCDARLDGGAMLALSPVRIISGVNGAPDSLAIMSGDSHAAPVRLAATLAPGAAATVVGSTLGMVAGDLLALQEEGRPCALVRVSGVDSMISVTRAAFSGNALTAANDAVPVSGYSDSGYAFNLGQLRQVTYAADSDTLRRTVVINAGTAASEDNVGAGIVSLKAQYGFDTRSGSTSALQIDTWSASLLDADHSGVVGDRGDWQRIAGLRLALVARSPYREARDVSGHCSATVAGAANAPGWQAPDAQGVLRTADISLAHLADWQCYRYRVYETVVPLRNVLWGRP
jgi:type IV pilus assembly protein PilW